MTILFKDAESITIVLRLNDAHGDSIVADKAIVLKVHVSQVRRWRESIIQAKEYSLESINEQWDDELYAINTTKEKVIDAFNKGLSPSEIIIKYGNLSEIEGLNEFESKVDKFGNIYIKALYGHAVGNVVTEAIYSSELVEEFKEFFGKNIKETPESNISKEDFMEFWRSDGMPDMLTVEDRMEIFLSAPVGSSDITKELLEKIIRGYGVENLTVIKSKNIGGQK